MATIEEISRMLKNGELVEVSVIARKLQRSRTTVLNWIYEGRVKGRRIGKRWYVVKKSLEDFLER